MKDVPVPMDRRGRGYSYRGRTLLANHFKVTVTNFDIHFSHYSVSLSYEDGRPVVGKGIGRKLVDEVLEKRLGRNDFAYDGEKSLFTVNPLPHNTFTVVLDDVTSIRTTRIGSPGYHGSSKESHKRLRSRYQSKYIKVKISLTANISMQDILNTEPGKSQEALRVLDIILRQHAAKQGCLLVRQSFFDPKNFRDVGGGVLGCLGFHSSFQPTQGGLSLNIDVSTTMIIQPGPVVQFLIANQNVKNMLLIDWAKAKDSLQNLRVKTSPSNAEYKITGLSELPCKEQMFSLKSGKDGNEEVQTIEITVHDYFVNHRKIPLVHSAVLPCINVGKPKRPTYFPLELCSLVSLQRYTKELSTLQITKLRQISCQKPEQRKKVLSEALKINNYDADPMLSSCGISISTKFTEVRGRVIQAPQLEVGYGCTFTPKKGRWDFNKQTLAVPFDIKHWAVAIFGAFPGEFSSRLVRDLINCGKQIGITIDTPLDVVDEDAQYSRDVPLVRVEKMCEKLRSRIHMQPNFLLCVLPKRKSSDLYGPWKRKNLVELGVVTQCIAPKKKVNYQYLTNVLLKINAKLGGLNSLLAVPIPKVSDTPTMIIGMNVLRGSPGQSDIPSIAAVVSSRWPEISRYRASVRTQSPKVEMIDSLFRPIYFTKEDHGSTCETKKDDGIISELLLDFYLSSRTKPDQIIIFRDGVSESQFGQVLNIELDQIIEACKVFDDAWFPKFVVIVAQKNHHTKFFQQESPVKNVPPGTVIDTGVCHLKSNDFYLCAHAGMIGTTTRPTHYHVLLDDISDDYSSANFLQRLVHSLSYVYQRSSTAISVVAPLRYAQLAAAQMKQFMKVEDVFETSSSLTSAAAVPVPQLPILHENVRHTMFFC